MVCTNDDVNDLSQQEIEKLFDFANDIFETDENNKKNKNSNNHLCVKCNTDVYLFNDRKSGNRVCSKCGTVNGDIIDNSAGYAGFDDENKTDATGNVGISYNELLPQSSLSTTISGGSNRLKTLQNWNVMPYRERSLNIVYKIIKKICEENKIIKCVEIDAQIMYKKLSDCKHVKGKNKGKYIIIRGSNRMSLIAACIFYACRNKGITRSPKEIATMFNNKQVKMTNGCKMFRKLCNIKQISMLGGISLAEHFIKRFCDELKIKEPYVSRTIKIAKNTKKINIASKHVPYSIAVGSILLMAEINNFCHLDKKFISSKFGVSNVTIDKTLNKMRPHKDILIADDLIIDELIKIMREKEKQIQTPQHIIDKQKKFGVYIHTTMLEVEDDEEVDYGKEQLEFDMCEEYLLDENYDVDELELCDDNYEYLCESLINFKLEPSKNIEEYLDLIDQINDYVSFNMVNPEFDIVINNMKKRTNKKSDLSR